MKNLIKKIIFEPLMHFIVVGMLLFMYFDYFNDENKNILQTISISNNEIQSSLEMEIYKNNSFLLDALVQEKYYKKILLEEAFVNNLYLQNRTIRDKLIKQMQFLVDGEMIDPTEEELKKYYEENKEDYSIKSSITFYVLSMNKLDEDKQKEIYKTLLQSNPENFEDNLNYYEMSREEIEAKYGKYFTLKLFGQKKSTWSQAIHSKEGIYSVYVKGYEILDAEVFDEIIDRVYYDFKAEALEKKRKLFFVNMKNKYKLEVTND